MSFIQFFIRVLRIRRSISFFLFSFNVTFIFASVEALNNCSLPCKGKSTWYKLQRQNSNDIMLYYRDGTTDTHIDSIIVTPFQICIICPFLLSIQFLRVCVNATAIWKRKKFFIHCKHVRQKTQNKKEKKRLHQKRTILQILPILLYLYMNAVRFYENLRCVLHTYSRMLSLCPFHCRDDTLYEDCSYLIII